MFATANSLARAPVSTPLYTLRPHRGSDTPIIFTSHHAQYVKQWGWNAAFMTVVSDILTSYATCHDPAIERFWVAERNSDGEFLGCVMLIDMSTRESETVSQSPNPSPSPSPSQSISPPLASPPPTSERRPAQGRTARLRVLYVSPLARGMGLGRALVHTTTEFAQQAGYRKVQLSTCTRQEAALRIYDEEGYRIVSEVEDESFGPSLRHLVLELELGEGVGGGNREGNREADREADRGGYREGVREGMREGAGKGG